MIEIRNATQEDLDLVRQDSIDITAKNYPVLNLNGWARTVLIDGQIIGVGGCIVFWKGVGEAWFCLSKKALDHKIATFRCIKKIIEQAFSELKLKRMQVTERADFSQTIKMAESLGFKREGLMKSYLPDGGDSYLYALIRK